MTTFTIGEVLNRLKDEFSDVTISKIRFLESEGLISPDRTESGYRKFTESDVVRLRYILRAQRDRYLPLKVILEELDRIDAEGGGYDDVPSVEPAADDRPAPGGELDLDVDDEVGDAGVQLTLSELASRTGLSRRQVDELDEHGLLTGEPYDDEAVAVAEAAARLLRDGLEVRHLRMYRQFADRESGVIEQLVTPLLRQRNPDSRRDAVAQAERLAAAGDELRRLLLAHRLRSLLSS